MKKLSIEEKAKRYDEILAKAKRYYDEYKTRDNILYVEDMEDMFPELKESEDERIRKWIIGVLSTYEHDRDLRNAAIAYLEKQGEQKPANKVEPKFKVGDWISGYYTNYKVLSVNNDGYLVEDVDGNKINILFENEKFHHLFTIADAKDGDVLAAKTTIGYPNPFIAIYKEHGLNFFNSHCFVSLDGEFHEGTTGHSISDIHPATKEQRDTLEKAMADAGYTFDFEKKELKNIKQHAWSEEDERNLNDIILFIKTGTYSLDKEKLIDWLKSHKPQSQWKPSEELDEASYQVGIKRVLDNPESYGLTKYNWKPSKEQIKAVKEAACYSSVFSEKTIDNLISLSKQLKAL